MTLISKLQYKDFEPGEFTGRQARTLEETLTLIQQYPWQQQRDHLAIGLTNPSITIEGPKHGFLKLSPFYNGKYVLHYLDPAKHLYTCSFEELTAAAPIIRSFFDVEDFDPAGFKKETTWLQDNDIHLPLLLNSPTAKPPYTPKPSLSYNPRLRSSLRISPSSRPVCPDTELFSCARRIR